MAFDFRHATVDEILEEARTLEGRRIGDIEGATLTPGAGGHTRHHVGRAVEHFFGMPVSNEQAPDFPGAGIELKTVPLVRRGRAFTVKERTVISQINYASLVNENWATAVVRKKLKILFVFFEYLEGREKSEFPIKTVTLWQPEGHVEAFIRADWMNVRHKVKAGEAHLLSESDGRIMGPCTKAADSSVRKRQPVGSEPAKPRAWALKPSFTLAIYREATGSRGATESLIRNLAISRVGEFEIAITDHVERYVGRTVGDVGDELGVKRSRSKNYAATVLRRVLGASSGQAKIEEFELMGLTPRITRVSPDRLPYESTSFPYFRYFDLLRETWEDSALLSQVEYMLFVPLIGARKETPQAGCTIGPPVFWRPIRSELEVIREEWEMYRREIRDGRANNLTPASRTRAIHIRPHGRDASDTDDAPIVGPVVKKSFWLNKEYVQEILLAAG